MKRRLGKTSEPGRCCKHNGTCMWYDQWILFNTTVINWYLDGMMQDDGQDYLKTSQNGDICE